MFLNEAFLKTYGFSDQDLSESSISQIRSPNNPPEVVREILPATLRGGWNGELLNRKKDGSEFLVSLSTAVVKDISEQPLALIGVANDITERRRMELENLVIYEITRGIAASSNLDELLSLIHDALSKVVYAENCFVALYNKEAESFSFPYFVDRFDTTPPSATLDKSCTAYVFRTVRPLLLTQEKFDNLVQQNEVELIGSNAPSWIGVPLRTPAETIGVLVLQHYEKDNVYSEKDVNFLTSVGSQVAIAIDRKKAEEEIRIKNEQLQSSNAEKDKFFSIIAHDLRGPLSAFVETTRIITEDIQSMTLDDIRSISMSMEKDAANVYALLENLLEWSRLQRGMMDFSPKKIKLNDIISAGVSVVAGSVKTKDIKLDVKIPDNIVVIADKDMIETIVRNLVSNAVKFTPAGGRITIYAVVNPGNVAEIRITDTGIGMSPELKDKLFRMNEKTSRPGTAGELSSGLGLLLCKEFVEKHKGRIWVESKEGQGSTFFFTLVIVT
jgi:PAS domain S-box-containing protein